MARYPYVRSSSPFDSELSKFAYLPLINVALEIGSRSVNAGLAYIDTGAQWCLFDNGFARPLGIQDYKSTKFVVELSGIGGGEKRGEQFVKKMENKAYFHEMSLLIFKDPKKLKRANTWRINTKVGFLENSIGFSGILGVIGFLDQFQFTTNIPRGYFEIEPLFEIEEEEIQHPDKQSVKRES